MAKCMQCGGEGYNTSTDPDEQARGIVDVCYHCLKTGECDDPECDCGQPDEVIEMRQRFNALLDIIMRLEEYKDRGGMEDHEPPEYINPEAVELANAQHELGELKAKYFTTTGRQL